MVQRSPLHSLTSHAHEVKSLSRVLLLPTGHLRPWNFPARVLEWIAISFSRGPSRSKDWTQVSHIAGRRFTIWATREAHTCIASLTINIPYQNGVFVTFDESTWRHHNHLKFIVNITIHSWRFSSYSLNKWTMACIYHLWYRIIQSMFNALKTPGSFVFIPHSSSHLQTLATTHLFTVSRILLFSKCQIVGITWYITFSN